MATDKQNNFVKAVYNAAKELQERNGNDAISPLFVTAQAALESGWGDSAIGNNLFGITKGSSWAGKTKLVLTTEYFDTSKKRFVKPERVESVTAISSGRFKYRVYRLFRDYDSLSDCLADHLKILRRPMYRDAWPYRRDAMEFARRISDSVGARYATAPDYAETMGLMIRQVQIIVERLGL